MTSSTPSQQSRRNLERRQNLAHWALWTRRAMATGSAVTPPAMFFGSPIMIRPTETAIRRTIYPPKCSAQIAEQPTVFAAKPRPQCRTWSGTTTFSVGFRPICGSLWIGRAARMWSGLIHAVGMCGRGDIYFARASHALTRWALS